MCLFCPPFVRRVFVLCVVFMAIWFAVDVVFVVDFFAAVLPVIALYAHHCIAQHRNQQPAYLLLLLHIRTYTLTQTYSYLRSLIDRTAITFRCECFVLCYSALIIFNLNLIFLLLFANSFEIRFFSCVALWLSRTHKTVEDEMRLESRGSFFHLLFFF